MPRVRIEYDLPHEQEAFEDAMLGADSVKALRTFRVWLRGKLEQMPRDEHAKLSSDYGRALNDCRKQLDRLLTEEEVVAENDDEGEER